MDQSTMLFIWFAGKYATALALLGKDFQQLTLLSSRRDHDFRIVPLLTKLSDTKNHTIAGMKVLKEVRDDCLYRKVRKEGLFSKR